MIVQISFISRKCKKNWRSKRCIILIIVYDDNVIFFALIIFVAMNFSLLQVEMSPATYSTTDAFNKLKNQTSHNKTEVAFDTKAPKCVQKINKNPGEFIRQSYMLYKLNETVV